MAISRSDTGSVLRMALPFIGRPELQLARHGDEMVITVGSYRRDPALPAALRGLHVAAARVEAAGLQVRFVNSEE